MLDPIVRVIASTKFIDVPFELSRGDFAAIDSKQQNYGSNCAKLIECAGRTCYDSYGQGRSSVDYHKHILEVGHGSVLEHASISFYLDNISRGCTHELVRHRAGTAISQRSTRYVDESDSKWMLHPLLVARIEELEAEGVAREAIDDALLVDCTPKLARDSYDCIVQHLQKWLIDKGVDKFTARKQARGAARGMLGNALCTSMVWTANIRALRNVIEQRASPHADAEIRVLANKLYEAAYDVCPEYFADYNKVECTDGIGYGLTTQYRKV